jgi:hypothetical protein
LPPRPSLSLFSLTQQLSIGKIINVWNVLRLATYKTTMDIVEIRVEIETCADEGYTHNYVVIKRKEREREESNRRRKLVFVVVHRLLLGCERETCNL